MSDDPPATPPPRRTRALDWSARLLVAVTWLSTAIFGLYIVAYYGGAAADGTLERWNDTLPDLYAPSTPLASVGIGSHFVAGGILLVLGPTQLIGALRERAAVVHRWVGRLFVVAAGITALGGLTFIALRGTIGGGVMDLGFGLYGGLTLLAAVQTARHARARRFDIHRQWGIRLFALVIGSWLYRIEYGLWFMTLGEVGHTHQFDGAFDWFMAFAFYLPNLLVAELFLRARAGVADSPRLAWAVTGALAATSGLILTGTYFFTREYWGPEILARF